MSRDQIEKLSTLFLAVFSTGLAAVLASDGMGPAQWLGAAVAVVGSFSIAVTVRLWPRPAPAAIRSRTRG